MKLAAFLLPLLALAGCASNRSAGTDAAFASGPIDPARMSIVTRTLASDEFEGRGPGTDGEAKTIAYLSEQFRQLGLEPAGDDGSYAQRVPLVRTRLKPGGAVSIAKGNARIPLAVPGDIYLSTVRETDAARIAGAPIVFVGYGVSAPERQWDDFKGVDLAGKVALFLVNDPDFEAAPGDPVAGRFGGKAMTYYGRWSYKFEEAARRGAIAALVVHETEGAGYGWSTVEAPGGENYNIMLSPGAQQPVLLQGWLQRPAAEDLFRRAGLDFETVKREARTAAFRPIDLGARLDARFDVEARRVESHNVLARISGSKRPQETIWFAGHWDAYGIGAPDAQGRTVRPGALDDALGIAGVLELARAFKAGPPPERTLVFAAWTAEERGLLGAEHYAAHPTFPFETTVANLTLDTLQPNGPARDVVLIGAGQSDLETRLAAAARLQGRTLTPDARPERGLFYRADHFAFAKRGVPVLLIMALGGGVDLVEGGREAGDRWVSEFTAHCYHQSCDAWSPDWDLRGAAQDVALFYTLGRDLAFSRAWPEWKQGSEFAPLRAKSAAARR
ncbi:M20/M25/M40 family metallo-hydrolase [Sphingomonas parva]|uniref:M20/M25/M40 family metallo-hydrolase n=1 Tax=Sphingomonas parva TaxID=2555898 RepID=A0A4Y8ZNH6_9SPHN|nr:M28 family metallopeptidase [Sphingomonas parva]TFI57583.1 M20/M25/M40 family metallo-hydrolase [Sphingomonas parva]